MIVIHAVLEAGALPDFAFWPVAEQPPYSLVPLNGALSPDQIGTAVASLADYNSIRADTDGADPAAVFLSPLLHEEGFVALGGLRVHDTATGRTVPPGCCFGLEDWREWLEVADGRETWLGHDPTPWTEQTGERVRLHPDRQHPGQPIDIPRTQLHQLLAGVQQDLAGFLLLVSAWADRHAPASAEALVEAFDRSLEITAPLRTGHG